VLKFVPVIVTVVQQFRKLERRKKWWVVKWRLPLLPNSLHLQIRWSQLLLFYNSRYHCPHSICIRCRGCRIDQCEIGRVLLRDKFYNAINGVAPPPFCQLRLTVEPLGVRIEIYRCKLEVKPLRRAGDVGDSDFINETGKVIGTSSLDTDQTFAELSVLFAISVLVTLDSILPSRNNCAFDELLVATYAKWCQRLSYNIVVPRSWEASTLCPLPSLSSPAILSW